MSEHGALEREGVVLAVLTAGIDPSGSDLVDETLVDRAPEPRSVQPGQIHAGDDSSASRFDELVHQLGRRLTPDWLEVLTSVPVALARCSARALSLPPDHIRACLPLISDKPGHSRCFDCGLLS